ncbi:hypothetical protein [Fusibacter ferrireducens]|uniref:DUF4386 domain-containing protein n=1 Tax=Fusibacter ferrireducens TaxID=2785058 RepID=A0ABR9ZSA7_9FIRM|nr:hypothetical protein [Fusibacter ferrireducens]MBF4693344.1 hypothetical protein [Fusibacter ferrireducens]
MKQTKIGGLSSIVLALIYLVGIVMQMTLLSLSSVGSVQERFTFISENSGLMIAWISLLYIVFGIIKLLLTVALHDLIAVHSGYMSRLVLGSGIIWSTLVIASGMIFNTGLLTAMQENSVSLFQWIETIHSAIGGNNEVIGAFWMLIIVIAGFQFRLFPNWMNTLGLVVAIGGALTMVPAFYNSVIMIFAMGQMIWWIALGIYLLRKNIAYAK